MARQEFKQPQGGSRAAASSRRGGGARQAGQVGNLWREFTGQMRSFTDNVPFTARGRARRAIDNQWEQWDDSEQAAEWSDPRDDFAGGGFTDAPSVAAPAPGYPGARSKGANVRRERRKSLPTTLLITLTLLSLLLGCAGTQVLLHGLDMVSATLDMVTQISALDSIYHSGGYTQIAALDEMQGRLESMDTDLQRVQADLPGNVLESNGMTGGMVHMLNMAELFVHAGEYGLDAGTILLPAIHGMMSNLGSSPGTTKSTASPTASSTTPTLTVADLERVTADVDQAMSYVRAAMAERAQVSDADLRAIGLGKVVTLLDKLDTIAPKLAQYSNDIHYGISALPALLGMTSAGAAKYLLFDQDSDELRPTGGFMGNYALLSFDQGRLTSGVHLQDIYSLDCPHGGYPVGCPQNLLPHRFSWLSDDPTHFGVRDSNLDPNFATSADYIEQNYKLETGQTVSGVISFTPAFIGSILDQLGGIELPAYNVKVTSANLQNTIHYYHILYAYCENSAYASQPQCKAEIKGGGAQASDKKTFDALLGSALLHAVASGGAKVQGKVLKAALDSISTRDLQIFFNNPQVEGLLTVLHADNTIPAINGDQLLIVDANTGATYANGDLVEQEHDTITLNADGSASHDLTITYTYPYK